MASEAIVAVHQTRHVRQSNQHENPRKCHCLLRHRRPHGPTARMTSARSRPVRTSEDGCKLYYVILVFMGSCPVFEGTGSVAKKRSGFGNQRMCAIRRIRIYRTKTPKQDHMWGSRGSRDRWICDTADSKDSGIGKACRPRKTTEMNYPN